MFKNIEAAGIHWVMMDEVRTKFWSQPVFGGDFVAESVAGRCGEFLRTNGISSTGSHRILHCEFLVTVQCMAVIL